MMLKDVDGRNKSSHDAVTQSSSPSAPGSAVRMLRRSRQGHGNIMLCEVPPTVLRALQVTQLHRQFQIHDSEAAALAAMGAGTKPAQDAAATGAQILCLHYSLDMLAYLRTLLNSAGYDALTTVSVADAAMFLKTGKAKLILLGASLETVHGSSVKERFKGLAPAVPVHILTAEFCAQEPSEAGPQLLEQIRGMIA